MADIRVRSTDGNNADEGSTWALAVADLHTATTGGLAKAGAGGKCYASQSHAQTTAGAVTLASAGSYDNPTYVVCGNDAADPPTAAATTATVTNSSTGGFTFTGSAYYRGVTFQCTAAVTTDFKLNNGTAKARSVFDNCSLISTQGSAGTFNFGLASANSRATIDLIDTNVKLPNSTSSGLNIYNARVHWHGGALQSQTNLPTTLIIPQNGYGCDVELLNVDLSVLGSGKSLVSAANEPSVSRIVFRDCKLGSGVSLVSATPAVATMRVEAFNCDSGDTNYRLWIEDFAGTITDETTLVMTGGATDGTTPISWKMASNANTSELVAPLASPEMAIWNETTGSSKTVTVEILHDSATNLTDAEVWLEVSYLGTSGFPLGSTVSDHRADILTTAADQTASSATWTTTGMTNPNKQKLSVSFTPQEKGNFTGRVVLAKASKTIYVNCEMTVS